MSKKKQFTNMRNMWIIIAVLAVCIVILAVMRLQSEVITPEVVSKTNYSSFNFGNQKILLNGEKIALKNGAYESEDRLHNAIIINTAINTTGERAAAILVDSPGGIGTFYYLIGAMSENGKTLYSSPMPLGDRFKIINVTVSEKGTENNGVVVVSYLTRPDAASMSQEPNIEAAQKFAFEDDGNLIPVIAPTTILVP